MIATKARPDYPCAVAHPTISELVAFSFGPRSVSICCGKALKEISNYSISRPGFETASITCLAWSPSQAPLLLSVGDTDGVVSFFYSSGEVIDITTNNQQHNETLWSKNGSIHDDPLKALNTHSGFAIKSMVFHPIQPILLATCSEDGSVKLTNIRSKCCIAILPCIEYLSNTYDALSCSFDCLGSCILVGCKKGMFGYWNLEKEEFITAFCLSMDGTQLPNSFRPWSNLPDFAKAPSEQDQEEEEQDKDETEQSNIDGVCFIGDFLVIKNESSIKILKKNGTLVNQLVSSESLTTKKPVIDINRELVISGSNKGNVIVWKFQQAIEASILTPSFVNSELNEAISECLFIDSPQNLLLVVGNSGAYRIFNTMKEFNL